MNFTQALRIAGVPQALHAEAISSVTEANARCKGLLWPKLKARWLKAGRIADALAWGDNRLLDVRPDWAELDIAPMANITCNGDHIDWMETPAGGRPNPDCWLNPDPSSEEYQRAVATNHRYCKGQHPRSKAARKAWYRRNAGEYCAWRVGAPVDPAQGLEIWRGSAGNTAVVAWRVSGAWIFNISRKVMGPLHLNTRVGYEVDNVFCGDQAPQMWWPIAGYELRAPVTSSTLPGGALDLSAKKWEAAHTVATERGTYTRLENA